MRWQRYIFELGLFFVQFKTTGSSVFLSPSINIEMVTWGCVEILQQCVCSSFSTFLSHIEFRKARESELLCVCVCALTLFSRVLFKVNLASPCPLSSVDHICSLTSFLCTDQTVCLSLLHVVCHLPQALTLSAHVLLDQSKLFVTAERPAGHTDRNVCVCAHAHASAIERVRV